MALSAVKKEPAKPQQSEAAPAAAAAPASAAGKKSKTMLFAGLALALVGVGAGGGAWWYMRHEPAGSSPEKHKVEPVKPPVFAPLDAFTVNLQQEESAQFAQVGLTLRMTDEAAVSELKLRMPEVRDRILLMLSSKKAAQLLSVEGKRKLAEEIRAAVNAILAPEAVLKIAAARAAERAAAAKRKPAPAGAEAAEGQEGGQQAELAEAAEAVAEVAPHPIQVVLPVTGVLFTSFLVQ